VCLLIHLIIETRSHRDSTGDNFNIEYRILLVTSVKAMAYRNRNINGNGNRNNSNNNNNNDNSAADPNANVYVIDSNKLNSNSSLRRRGGSLYYDDGDEHERLSDDDEPDNDITDDISEGSFPTNKDLASFAVSRQDQDQNQNQGQSQSQGQAREPMGNTSRSATDSDGGPPESVTYTYEYAHLKSNDRDADAGIDIDTSRDTYRDKYRDMDTYRDRGTCTSSRGGGSISSILSDKQLSISGHNSLSFSSDNDIEIHDRRPFHNMMQYSENHIHHNLHQPQHHNMVGEEEPNMAMSLSMSYAASETAKSDIATVCSGSVVEDIDIASVGTAHSTATTTATNNNNNTQHHHQQTATSNSNTQQVQPRKRHPDGRGVEFAAETYRHKSNSSNSSSISATTANATLSSSINNNAAIGKSHININNSIHNNDANATLSSSINNNAAIGKSHININNSIQNNDNAPASSIAALNDMGPPLNRSFLERVRGNSTGTPSRAGSLKSFGSQATSNVVHFDTDDCGGSIVESSDGHFSGIEETHSFQGGQCNNSSMTVTINGSGTAIDVYGGGGSGCNEGSDGAVIGIGTNSGNIDALKTPQDHHLATTSNCNINIATATAGTGIIGNGGGMEHIHSTHQLHTQSNVVSLDKLSESSQSINNGRRSPGGTVYKGRGVRKYQGRYMHLPLKRFHQNGVTIPEEHLMHCQNGNSCGDNDDDDEEEVETSLRIHNNSSSSSSSPWEDRRTWERKRSRSRSRSRSRDRNDRWSNGRSQSPTQLRHGNSIRNHDDRHRDFRNNNGRCGNGGRWKHNYRRNNESSNTRYTNNNNHNYRRGRGRQKNHCNSPNRMMTPRDPRHDREVIRK